MFVIRCTSCGREQNWSDGVIPGQGTEIEVADKAVYCSCGASIEEENGRLVAYKTDGLSSPQLVNNVLELRRFNVRKNFTD